MDHGNATASSELQALPMWPIELKEFVEAGKLD